MTETTCPSDSTLRRAAAEGVQTAELRAHVEGCVSCAETLRVAAFLGELAATPAPRLPGAGPVWWRAQILRDLAAEDAQAERAARPALWGLIGGVLLALLGVFLAAAWQTDVLTGGDEISFVPIVLSLIVPTVAGAAFVALLWRAA